MRCGPSPLSWWPLTTAPLAAPFRPHVHTANCAVCQGSVSAQAEVSVKATAPLNTVPTRRQALQQPRSPSAGTRIEWMRDGLIAWMQLADRGPSPNSSPPALLTERTVSVPAAFRFPLDDDVALPAFRRAVESSNDFLHRLLSVPEAQLGGKEGMEKQLLHQQTLLDFQAIMNVVAGVGVRFFLVCGTALGAQREGYFIPHDDDIDVGVFYEDLVALGRRETLRQGNEQEEGDVEKEEEEEVALASSAVRCVLSSLTIQSATEESPNGRFLAFDICGSVGKGLEVRLMHLTTGVRLDLNVYYTTQEKDVDGGTPFTWSASFYEEAEKRKHGMYRYKHNPFHEALERVAFCSRKVGGEGGSDNGFLVPPTSYLEEYYGADWRTPKAYSYVDGLRGEYKNIIPE